MSNSFLPLVAWGGGSGVMFAVGVRGLLSQATQRHNASRQAARRSNGKGGQMEAEVFKGRHPRWIKKKRSDGKTVTPFMSLVAHLSDRYSLIGSPSFRTPSE